MEMLSQACAVSPPLLGGRFAASAPRVRAAGSVPAQEAPRMRSLARISALLRRREGRAAPPETAPGAERRPLEVLGVQGKDGGVLGVGDPETLHLLVIKRKGREERNLFRFRKKKRQWLSLD